MMCALLLTRSAARRVAVGIRHRLKWLCLFASACLILSRLSDSRGDDHVPW